MPWAFSLGSMMSIIEPPPANPSLQEQEFYNFRTSSHRVLLAEMIWCHATSSGFIGRWSNQTAVCKYREQAGCLLVVSSGLTKKTAPVWVTPLLCCLLPFSDSIPLHRDRASVRTPSDADFAVILLENGTPGMEEEASICIGSSGDWWSWHGASQVSCCWYNRRRSAICFS